VNNRVLGTISMICAPAMLIQGLLRGDQENALITGIASMVFMAGSVAIQGCGGCGRPGPAIGVVPCC
jgi:hypothetical protein